MKIQQNIINFILYSNWIILTIMCLIGIMIAKPDFIRGLFFGGLIVTINFHLLKNTLKKALISANFKSYNVVLIKYYIRFTISAIIILILIQQKLVNPLGLFLGLSVIVLSIMLATIVELKKLIFKEETV